MSSSSEGFGVSGCKGLHRVSAGLGFRGSGLELSDVLEFRLDFCVGCAGSREF